MICFPKPVLLYLLTTYLFYFYGLCNEFGVVKSKIHFMALEKRAELREYLLHDGFTPGYVDGMLLPVMYDLKFSPEDADSTARSEWGIKLIGRPLQDFRSWIKDNIHYFIS